MHVKIYREQAMNPLIIQSEEAYQSSVMDLLMNQSKAQPTNIAVTFQKTHLTYQELTDISLKISRYLQYLGVGTESFIGIYLEPSLDLIPSIFGTLAAGAAYIPLSTEYPAERLNYMVNDSGLKIIITQDKLKEKIKEITPPDLLIITIEDALASQQKKQNIAQIRSLPMSKQLAYVIYTSGSTGKPKGVMIEHQSIINQLNWLKDTFSFNENTVILQKTPMSFDAAQWEILAPCFGAKVIIAEPGSYKNPEQLTEILIRNKITTLQCVPALLQSLVNADRFDECHYLKQLFIGGEALSKHTVLSCMKMLPSCGLINLYGPTESTINASSFIINNNIVDSYTKTVPIGKPIANNKFYVLNNKLQPVADGEIGELYISGEGLARGYVNQPELTNENFIDNPFGKDYKHARMYKTGDLVSIEKNGNYKFIGRVDNQIKLRGYRIELDEVKSIIETHSWVNNSAVILNENPNTGYQQLAAFIELNSKEATLMDQGNHDSHHLSKNSKSQLKMQLSNKGCREESQLDHKKVINLPGRNATSKQVDKVFSRKTYRFFEGGLVTINDIHQLLKPKKMTDYTIEVKDLSYEFFGEILRYFGQYASKERLLPKYGYASPGALYATQMYLEIDNIDNIKSGYYYYHPIRHQLIMTKSKENSNKTKIKTHFIGKKSAIEPIYKNNIQEVLELETGHMVGLFENILPDYGLKIVECDYTPEVKKSFDVSSEDYYLGSFEFANGEKEMMDYPICVYIQAHAGKVKGLSKGLYLYMNEKFHKQSDNIIEKSDVIAINQEVYERSSFGISITSRADKEWMSYINLGRRLQSIQMNDMNFGFMSSGYSSKTGNNLPSAIRIQEILERKTGASYFIIGGAISEQQRASCGMHEDTVHMKGPTEILKDDLMDFLPDYMMPNNITILDKMPLTVNGKIDYSKLKNIKAEAKNRKFIAPRNKIEQQLLSMWQRYIKNIEISVNDNFFELGGNSLIAVSLVNQINNELNCNLPLQILFDTSSIERLAQYLSIQAGQKYSRLIPLQNKREFSSIFCWPGLGGYCMNLRLLASKLGSYQPFYGVQAHGINAKETAFGSIDEMATKDVEMILKTQPEGPFSL